MREQTRLMREQMTVFDQQLGAVVEVQFWWFRLVAGKPATGPLAVASVLRLHLRHENHLSRLARLLGTMAENTAERFDDVESRLDKLESA